jgi:hypothetical protein
MLKPIDLNVRQIIADEKDGLSQLQQMDTTAQLNDYLNR